MVRSKTSLLIGAAALLAASACGSDGPGQSTTTTGFTPSTSGANNGTTGTSGAVTGAATGGTGTVGGTTGGDGGLSGVNGSTLVDGSTQKGVVDPTGVWWTEVEAIGTQDLPTVGILENSKIRFVMRVVIEGTVPNQTATFEFCKLETLWASDVLPDDVHRIGFRPAAAAAFGETVSVDFSGLGVGDAIPVPDLTFIAGADASGTVIDEDGDGYPAITTFVRIILPFEVAEVITIDAALDLTATDEDTLDGTLAFDVEADILDSSSAGFVPASYDVTIVPDSDAVPVTVRRIPGGGTCSDIPSTLEFAEIPPPPGPPVDPLVGPQYTP